MSGSIHASVASLHNPREIRHRRLLFQCWNRGTQESDFILGSFAEAWLESLDNAQLDRLEALLNCADPDLFDWMSGEKAPPQEHDHNVMGMLRSFCAGCRRGPQPNQRH